LYFGRFCERLNIPEKVIWKRKLSVKKELLFAFKVKFLNKCFAVILTPFAEYILEGSQCTFKKLDSGVLNLPHKVLFPKPVALYLPVMETSQ
jgi:hypothetical protein